MAVSRARSGLRWLLHSLAARLVLLSVVFLAVPLLLYQQFSAANEEKLALLLHGAEQQGILLARAVEPLLQRADGAMLPRLGDDLARFADAGTRIKLLLQPSGAPGIQPGKQEEFFYVAAAPRTSLAGLDEERQRLIDQGVLGRLAGTCSGNQPLALRIATPAGGQEVLTSITPVNTRLGCWAVVTSHDGAGYLSSSIGQPYWRTPEVQAAAAIYVAMAGLVLLLFFGVWRNLGRFGALARQIGSPDSPGVSFADRNTVPELAGVAEDFDRLVETLRHSADTLRRAAEDNAHAFKTPIAVIRQSVEPLKRIVPGGDVRGRRALDMIERSVDRLDGLVSFARRMDEAQADLLEPPRRRIDLSSLLDRMLGTYAGILLERRITPVVEIAYHLAVRASEELLETVIENLIENAISFSPEESRLRVRLLRRRETAVLTVEDEGPGVDSTNLERIFERYFSQRDPDSAPPPSGTRARAIGGGAQIEAVPDAHQKADTLHFGIGLWIVRRNVEAVGGTVKAANREEGGLCVRVTLPISH